MVLKKLFKFLKSKKITKKSKLTKKRKVKSLIKKRPIKARPKKIKKTKRVKEKKIVKKEKLIGKISHRFSKINVAIFKVKDATKIGDKIHIKGHTTDFSQKISSMQIDHQPVKTAKKGQEVGILVKRRVRINDSIYRI